MQHRTGELRSPRPPHVNLVPGHRRAGERTTTVCPTHSLLAGHRRLDIQQTESVGNAGRAVHTRRIQNAPAQHLKSAAQPQHPAAGPHVRDDVVIPPLCSQERQLANRR